MSMIESIREGSRVERAGRFGEVITRPYRGGRPVCLGTYFVRWDDSGQISGVGVDSLTLLQSTDGPCWRSECRYSCYYPDSCSHT